MKRPVLATVMVVCLALLGAAAAWADDARLTVTQDESSMEQTIERYLKANHNMIINEKTFSPDDLWLELPWGGDPMPNYRMSIDTQVLNKDSEGKVVERGIRVEGRTAVFVPEDKRTAVVKVINEFNRDKVFSAIYLDDDGEIMLDWTLNVLSEGLPTEYVYDVLAREQRLWQELYPLVSPLL